MKYVPQIFLVIFSFFFRLRVIQLLMVYRLLGKHKMLELY